MGKAEKKLKEIQEAGLIYTRAEKKCVGGVKE
jgi:hypothetical protein